MTDVVVGLSGILFYCLFKLHRIKEWHHGYYGIALYALSLFLGPVIGGWGRWLGLVLLADDSYQHAIETYFLARGWTVPGDFTPIHRLGSWLLTKFGGK